MDRGVGGLRTIGPRAHRAAHHVGVLIRDLETAATTATTTKDPTLVSGSDASRGSAHRESIQPPDASTSAPSRVVSRVELGPRIGRRRANEVRSIGNAPRHPDEVGCCSIAPLHPAIQTLDFSSEGAPAVLLSYAVATNHANQRTSRAHAAAARRVCPQLGTHRVRECHGQFIVTCRRSQDGRQPTEEVAASRCRCRCGAVSPRSGALPLLPRTCPGLGADWPRPPPARHVRIWKDLEASAMSRVPRYLPRYVPGNNGFCDRLLVGGLSCLSE